MSHAIGNAIFDWQFKMVLRQNILASSRPTGKGRSELSRHGRFGG